MAESPLRPAIASLGIIPFKPVSQLVEEEKERAQPLKTESPFINSLAAHLETCWQAARRAKEPIERQMMANLRQRNGIYDDGKLAAIRQMGGSEVYVLLTATKCRAAEAWIQDVIRPAFERPYSITPTPIPDLPDNIEDALRDEVISVADEVIRQAAAVGQQIGDPELLRELKKYISSRKDEELQKIRKEARDRAARMEDLISDQLAEGGWHNAFWQVVSDFVTLKGAILKGPVLRSRKTQQWTLGQNGWEINAEQAIVPEFDRVSPFDLYPAPDSRFPDDGYIIERHKLKRSDLQALIGVEGYSEKNIRMALKDYADGLHSTQPIDSERAEIEFAGETNAERSGEKIEALEFWGSVQGKLLVEWGLGEELDPELDYEINAWKVGSYVIRAILNPDKLGRKPYAVDSYERIPGSFWGKGVPELMDDVQDICNAVARAVVNNASLASGPQVEVNVERAANDEELFPWKIWQSTNQQMSEQPAVRFFQPTIITTPLLQVFEFFAALSEDQTGIPRWAYGKTDIGGAGETSSGLSMLMTHAARGIKEAISHLDTMIGGTIERVYDYNMAFSDDESVKGDARIVARGSSSLVVKEQQVVRLRELLRDTNNPADLQILGVEGRANLLQAAIKGLVPDLDVVPDEKGIQSLIEKIEQEQALALQQQQMQGAVPQKKPQALDAAGNPAGGVDNNLSQNQPGTTPGLRTVPTT